ncbi:HNH endonuclease [Candidatus Poribacteria bacterium]|nr:HNH endonuclease [Candidatus Poribacteria bacterium]
MELTFLALLKERGNLGLSSVETRELFGFKHIIQANRLISQIGKKYLKYAGIDFSNIRSLYEIVSDPEKNYRDENGFFKWVLREPFSKNVDSIISRIDNIATFYFIEGRRTKVENTYYERNIKARKKCIEHYGFICKICGFDFSKAYGEIGKGYIEVHHLVPIHEKKIEYHINPINDLIPVCSNCHSIIHRKNPPYCEEEIKDIINKKL